MSPQFDSIETLLSRLGKARQDGAFEHASAGYPWQSSAAVDMVVRHRRLTWLRVAVPLAAAAAIAVLFVGPSLFEGTAVDTIAQNIQPTVTPAQPEAFAEAQPVATSSAQTIDCDYNGDGRIDGQDIQAFVDRLAESGGDIELKKDFLRRCLLDGQ
jgi:hypothetical protein